MLNKILKAIMAWFKEDPRKKYVDDGLLDFSGQGRDKYGNYKGD